MFGAMIFVMGRRLRGANSSLYINARFWGDIFKHSSIDKRNYFQTSRGHVTWIVYRKLIVFLHIVVWHKRVHLVARGHVIRV